MGFKYIIVDDEPLARKLILSHTRGIDGLEFSGEFGSARDAGNILRTHSIDLVFLDIQMSELNGLQFVKTLKNPPAVIFTTAHRHYAPEAFDIDAIDYLLKPISFERLLKGVNKFFERHYSSNGKSVSANKEETSIYVKADRKIHKISSTDILYIESLDEFVKIHTHQKVLISREAISTIAGKLDTANFVRIHRSYIISKNYISSVSSEGVEIKGKLLPFGRAFKLSALAALGLRNISG